ncbi:hypothetical protein TSTA_041460 [Talaromyces stipitatus ATCC 10500]|uniref:Uncharacterized protein n=1 Tax=Talaromyces stipitatus (strain ATCC 10500 / CBS 375.48 / QM 6759 / NRRL 1006) TaxID=441959 RepID=B8MJ79_TALSN|nr:uncharacterized protein TSTA_041460 [Talaromyces stipitatus ATCC 10500]EED14668.1 hypothetical protein TSTA_041460 [Talaromyces stipitatus ATCC 10500]
MDAIFGTNSGGMDLFAVLAKLEGTGIPLGYCLVELLKAPQANSVQTKPRRTDPGAMTHVIQQFLERLENNISSRCRLDAESRRQVFSLCLLQLPGSTLLYGNDAGGRLEYLEKRVRQLEQEKRDLVSRNSSGHPFATLSDNHRISSQAQTFSSPPSTTRASSINTQYQQQDIKSIDDGKLRNTNTASTYNESLSHDSDRITKDQPLAHEVGLFSLANVVSVPKYLGPSSGVAFVRLIYASAPQTQGLPSRVCLQGDTGNRTAQRDIAQPVGLPSSAACQQFADSYFSTLGQLYPFILEDEFDELLGAGQKSSGNQN